MERASWAAAACCAARRASLARVAAPSTYPMWASSADSAGPTMPAAQMQVFVYATGLECSLQIHQNEAANDANSQLITSQV